MLALLTLLARPALADDTIRLHPGVGVWVGDSTSMVAAGANVGWQHGPHVMELGYDTLEEIFGRDTSYRTTVLYGRRKAWAWGPVVAAVDLSAGLGAGPDRSFVAPSSVAVGVVGQGRLSLGTEWLGLQARALAMAGTAPFDGACTVGVYVALPLD